MLLDDLQELVVLILHIRVRCGRLLLVLLGARVLHILEQMSLLFFLHLGESTALKFLVFVGSMNAGHLLSLGVHHVPLQLLVRLRDGLGLFILQPLLAAFRLELVLILLIYVTCILCVLIDLIQLPLLFDVDGVGNLALEVIEQVFGSLLLLTNLLFILCGHLRDFGEYSRPLPLSFLGLLRPAVVPVRDLVDEVLLAQLLPSGELVVLLFLLHEAADTVDLHHVLDAGLLFNVLFLQYSVLLELLVAHGDHPAEHHVLVHFLHFVELLIQLHLRRRQQALGPHHLLACRAWYEPRTVFLVRLLHLCPPDLRSGHHQFLVIVVLVKSLPRRLAGQLHLDAAQLLRGDDACIFLLAFLGLSAHVADFHQHGR